MKVSKKSPKVNPIVCVLMPAYNEEAALAQVIASIPPKIKVRGITYKTQVIVVDDCSTDNTFQIALDSGARVLRHIINSGAGAATRTGLYFASSLPDVHSVITIDSDGQHNVDDIKILLTSAIDEQADMVVGNRLHHGNKQSMPLHRRFGNWGLSMISRILFGITTQDTQSGLRLIKAENLKLLSDYYIDRYGFCTEMLWLAHRNNLKTIEVPINVTYSAETLQKGQNNWGVIGLVIDLLLTRTAR